MEFWGMEGGDDNVPSRSERRGEGGGGGVLGMDVLRERLLVLTLSVLLLMDNRAELLRDMPLSCFIWL